MSNQQFEENIKVLESMLTACNFARNLLSETSFQGTKDKAQKVCDVHRYLDEMYRVQEHALKNIKEAYKKAKYATKNNPEEATRQAVSGE